MADIDAEIDALYQLPLDEFTPARNALAKRLGRTDPPIKDLHKPSAPAWAVNQLYWQARPIYDRLVESSNRLRAAHRNLLAGKASDIRETEKVHRDAARAATERVKRILQEGGQASSPATMVALAETLEALPGADPPGRLTKPLKPMGFEALAGVTVRPSRSQPEAKASHREPVALKLVPKRDAAKEKERLRRAQQEQREAEVALKKAQAVVARAEQDVERKEQGLAEARKALDQVRKALREALTAHQLATRRVHE